MTKVKDCEKCQGCPMARLFPDNNLVPPQLGPSLRLTIAEAPGENESIEGVPLVGGTGKMFNALLWKAGERRDNISCANTIQCRPPDNIYPTDHAARHYISEAEAGQAVAHCYDKFVKPLLDSRPWTRIDAIGEKALRVLTGKVGGILKWRGSPLPLIGEDKPRVIPTLHPSYLMRQQYLIPAVISDLKKGLQIPPEFYDLQPDIDSLREFENTKVLCFDIETNRFTNEITMVGLSTRPYHVIVIPFRGAYIAALKRVFESASELVGQNLIAFDIPHLEANGIRFKEGAQVWDIMLMQHLLQPDMDHDLEFISSIFTQKPAWKHLASENKELYCARDVDVTIQSFQQLKPLLFQEKLDHLYNYISWPLAKICKLMSDTGIKQDPNRLHALRDKFLGEMVELEAKLPKELQTYDKPIRIRKPAPPGTVGKSGKAVKYIHVDSTERVSPWNSPKVLEQYLYTTLALPKQVHPKTKKITTDKHALERLIRKCSKDGKDETVLVLTVLGKIKKLDELISTFLKDDKEISVGKIHANFLVHGTSTGRLSSSNPNMQNIPARSRYIYVPPFADWCFIEGDFSSLENRLAAWYAGDTARLQRLNIPDFNEHRWLASQIYGIPESEISKDSQQYKYGKIANHGCDGAMGVRKLAMTHGLSEKEARDLIYQWRTINRPSAEWQERTGNTAQKQGLLVNAFERKRWFWTNTAYTEGIRFLPQSTGADVCFRAMIALMYERINWPPERVLQISKVLAPLPRPAQLVLQVHDSLLVACPQNLVEDCIHTMKAAMIQAWDPLGGYEIPAAFKVGAPGQSWGELYSYEETETNE